MANHQTLRAAYVTAFEPKDIHAWSGLIYHIKQALERSGIEVESLSNLKKGALLTCAAKLLFYKLRRKAYHRDREPALLENYARQIEERLDPNTDFIFSPGTLAIGKLKTDKPMVIWTDSTFAGLVETYPEFQNLCAETLKNGHEIEREILNNLALAIYSSEWAAQSAINYYGVDPKRVKVIPFGANLECDRTEETIRQLSANKSTETCRLLFVGVDWYRKGGETALAVAQSLNDRGIQTELHIVGVTPPIPVPSWVIQHGYLSKKDPDQLARLNKLMEESHFFILPSRSECFGIVFAEAASFGLPSIATKVGGIPSAISEGESGFLFELDSPLDKICDLIQEHFRDSQRYVNLSISSFRRYRSKLNWDVAGRAAKEAICDALASRPSVESSSKP
ncbi:glycosyltransferase family 4 protein [Roseibacillus persicicus]|uniref:glycosyltransferase family 4 protein n=1 Tax=Roseibacillus persicicus TaxID=454148 RepID=UPI00398BA15A